jgi:dTDP-glucose 4,6-dehydratase
LTYAGSTNNLISNPAVNFIKGNICDSELLKSIVSDFDAIVNFAAESHVDRSIENSKIFLETNIQGVGILLESLRIQNPNCRFVQVSTDEVYGSIRKGSWTEECMIQPNSPYSASKASGDLLARAFYQTHQLDVVTTRASNNYGPRQFPEKLIPFFISKLIKGEQVTLYGDGMNVRDWLHVYDHCDGIYLALVRGVAGEIYNIGGGTELTNLELTKKLIDLTHGNRNQIQYVADRSGHDFRYSLSWKKIKRELGYSPRIPFIDGLTDTVDWYLNHREWLHLNTSP